LGQTSHTETISTQKRKVVLLAVVMSAIVLLVLSAILLLSRANTGDQIIRQNNAEDLRDAVKILMDSYSGLITLVTASFGAVAFLITLQQTQAVKPTSRGWSLFAIGIVLLTLALGLAFVGREELLISLTRNAVDITLPALSLTRWLCYLCITLAAVLILSFAAEVAIAPVQAESPKRQSDQQV